MPKPNSSCSAVLHWMLQQRRRHPEWGDAAILSNFRLRDWKVEAGRFSLLRRDWTKKWNRRLLQLRCLFLPVKSRCHEMGFAQEAENSIFRFYGCIIWFISHLCMKVSSQELSLKLWFCRGNMRRVIGSSSLCISCFWVCESHCWIRKKGTGGEAEGKN